MDFQSSRDCCFLLSSGQQQTLETGLSRNATKGLWLVAEALAFRQENSRETDGEGMRDDQQGIKGLGMVTSAIQVMF